jgi:hypothetical protein
MTLSSKSIFLALILFLFSLVSTAQARLILKIIQCAK